MIIPEIKIPVLEAVKPVFHQFQVRLSPEYQTKQRERDLEYPLEGQLSLERHIIGVGFEGAWSFYFIFSDGSKSDTKSDFVFHDTNRQETDLSNFKEVFVDPEGTVVRKVRLRYRNKLYAGNQAYVGTLSAV